MDAQQPLDALIVGAGFGGIAAAIQLREHGFAQIEIIDSASGPGGTWLHNDYPGAACDVPSHLYSFSFDQRKDWKRLCPTQPEILDYIKAVVSSHGLDSAITPNTKVDSCRWSDTDLVWEISTATGRQIRAKALVLATGQLHQPAVPNIPGMEAFTGRIFHSAEWDQSVDISGKRVAVIGTGASAVQFIPEVAEAAGHLDVYQRTGNWFMPRRNRTYPSAVAFAIKRIPGVQAWRRKFIFYYGETLTAMIRHPRTLGMLGRLRSTFFMKAQVKDPVLRAKIWPDYTFGCKRVLFSSYFLPSLQLPNVDLLTDAVTGFTPDAVVTADGVERPTDVVILGTGFKTNDFMFPMEITGQAGIDLHTAWSDGPHAHLGMTVPGFPSMFLMYGPNTNTSGGSILVYLEAQAAYLRQALTAVEARGAAAVSVRPEVALASDRETQANFQGTAWVRCDSWYRDSDGRVVANWPGYMSQYVRRTQQFDVTEYDFLNS
ncbi:MAG: NAD(P)-binding protein [Actinobacteria bacterium]|uniref:Unannotated protein n=1 Tax=freshwater metagenome TaxID=449393 RepID=A0A6J7CUX2_9ZZZZ|nr:NAD(P)-binding protein [Actinomycetota bacterium]